MKLRHSVRTDVGRTRDHNEDSYGVGEPEQAERLGALLVVCDGMGGHAAGEVASGLAVEAILTHYYADDNDDADDAEERPVALERAFDQANDQIYATGHGSMGTTGVAALIHHDALHIANVGDSRAYLIREGQIRQVTRDHSFVSDQVAAGLITPEQARSSPHRNVITRALGYQPKVLVDMFRYPLQVGDIVLLCSDGLHGLVADDELAAIASAQPPDNAVDYLVELANQRGGSDNITVVIAHVDALDWDAQPVVAEDLAPGRERITVELPIDEEELAPPVALTEAPAAAPAAPAAAPVASVAVPGRATAERRLTLLGGLLATLLLSGLLLGTLFALSQPATTLTPLSPTAASLPTPVSTGTALPPTSLPAATAVPAATAAPVATALPAATAASVATAAPAASPRPTARPTGTTPAATSSP